MVNRLTNLDGLLDTGPQPADDKSKLAAALAAGMVLAEYQAEFLLALRAAARKSVEFYREAARVTAAHQRLAAVGAVGPLPTGFGCTPAELSALARSLIASELLAPADPVLVGIDLGA